MESAAYGLLLQALELKLLALYLLAIEFVCVFVT